jgi:hypothetical protein
MPCYSAVDWLSSLYVRGVHNGGAPVDDDQQKRKVDKAVRLKVFLSYSRADMAFADELEGSLKPHRRDRCQLHHRLEGPLPHRWCRIRVHRPQHPRGTRAILGYPTQKLEQLGAVR